MGESVLCPPVSPDMMSPMKKLLAIIILSLCFIIPSKANDIREFQIEGMSIGDSLLDYYSKDEILKRTYKPIKEQKSDDFLEVGTYASSNSIYGEIHFARKKNDNSYLIHNIRGIIDFKNNIKDCYKDLEKISNEISKMYPEIKFKKRTLNHQIGKNTVFSFKLAEGKVKAECVDYNKKIYDDHLSVSVSSEEYDIWLNKRKFN